MAATSSEYSLQLWETRREVAAELAKGQVLRSGWPSRAPDPSRFTDPYTCVFLSQGFILRQLFALLTF